MSLVLALVLVAAPPAIADDAVHKGLAAVLASLPLEPGCSAGDVVRANPRGATAFLVGALQSADDGSTVLDVAAVDDALTRACAQLVESEQVSRAAFDLDDVDAGFVQVLVAASAGPLPEGALRFVASSSGLARPLVATLDVDGGALVVVTPGLLAPSSRRVPLDVADVQRLATLAAAVPFGAAARRPPDDEVLLGDDACVDELGRAWLVEQRGGGVHRVAVRPSTCREHGVGDAAFYALGDAVMELAGLMCTEGDVLTVLDE